jgi:hypothetical protein
VTASRFSLEQCLASLSVANYWPKDPLQEQAIAEIVDEYCRSDQQRSGLARAMCKYNEWPGPATLIAECRAMTAEPVEAWQPKKEALCEKCGDSGFVIVSKGGSSGAERCGCRT